MTMQRLNRWAPLLGVAFVLCLAGAFFGPSTPDVNASSAKVIDFYGSHRGALMFQAYLLGIGGLLLVAFFGAMTAYLRRMGADALARVALAGSVIMAVAMCLGGTMNVLLTHKSVTMTASTAQTLNLLNNDLPFILLVVGLGLVAFATGIAILSTKAMPAWQGWVALVIGLVAIAGGPVGWFAIMASGLWVLALSITLYRRMDDGSAATISMPDAAAMQIPAQGQPQDSSTTVRS
jgi:hypothetical protein